MATHPSNDGTADHHSRRDHCIAINDLWYVATREGIDVGPFETKADAEWAAQKIAQLLEDVDDPAAALTFVREFLRRSRI